MKRILTLCALMTTLSAAQSAPFAFAKVASPAAQTCVVTGAISGEFPVVDAAHQGQRGCLIDVASVPVGDNTINVSAKSSLWGQLGTAVPFAFVRPSSASLSVELILLTP